MEGEVSSKYHKSRRSIIKIGLGARKICRNVFKISMKKVTMFANANAMTTVGRRSLEALRLQPLGKPPQCFS